MLLHKIILVFLSVLLYSCATHNAEKHNLPMIDQQVGIGNVPICYNYGCKTLKSIQIGEQTWERVTTLFSHNQSAGDERLAIRQAVAWLEQEAALHSPVGIDQPQNYNELHENGRQDCVDEATNTTHFLLLLENENLLQWHKTANRAYRAYFLVDQHFTAQIVHRQTGQLYVVDSWFLANGQLPFIQTYQDWARKKNTNDL